MNEFMVLITTIISIVLSIFIVMQIADTINKNKKSIISLNNGKKLVLFIPFILGIICWILEIVLTISKDTDIIIFFIIAPLVLFMNVYICIDNIAKKANG